jgi:uncharacterized protein (DUF58 family)
MPLTLDSQFFRKLDRFEILAHGIHRGGQIGHRRSVSRGAGLEFADHKEYSAGDDIRYLDWNLYARLEEVFIKIFEQEEALPIYILLDASGSMGLGEPTKLAFAARIAAALAYVGLANDDDVRVCLFAEGLLQSSKILRGKTQIYEILDLLDPPADGGTDLAAALSTFSAENRLPGMAFVLSDFLDPAGVLAGVRLLAGRRFGVVGMHVIAPEEARPDIDGDVELEDLETDRRLRVLLRRDTLTRYEQFFANHCADIRRQLQRYGARYLSLPTTQDIDQVLFARLPEEGVFR